MVQIRRVRETGVYGGYGVEGFTTISKDLRSRLFTQNPNPFLSTGTSPILIHNPGESMGLLLALTYATAGS